MMRYAFSTLSCPDWSIAQVVDAATRFGYDSVELRLLDGEPIDPVRDRAGVLDAVALCRAAGFDVCVLDTSCRFNLAGDDERAAQLADLAHWIALAQEAQVGLLRVFGGQDPAGSTREQADTRVAESLARIAPSAEAASVTIALETHDAFSSARRVARVLDRVPSPAIAALWDSHHPYRAGESPAEVIALLGPRLAHVHVKDARRLVPGGEEWQLVLMGEGEVPVREILHTLAQHDYDGWVSVEWEKKWHPDLPDPDIALPQHIEWLRAATRADR